MVAVLVARYLRSMEVVETRKRKWYGVY